jgi:hypothetical protein
MLINTKIILKSSYIYTIAKISLYDCLVASTNVILPKEYVQKFHYVINIHFASFLIHKIYFKIYNFYDFLNKNIQKNNFKVSGTGNFNFMHKATD